MRPFDLAATLPAIGPVLRSEAEVVLEARCLGEAELDSFRTVLPAGPVHLDPYLPDHLPSPVTVVARACSASRHDRSMDRR